MTNYPTPVDLQDADNSLQRLHTLLRLIRKVRHDPEAAAYLDALLYAAEEAAGCVDSALHPRTNLCT